MKHLAAALVFLGCLAALVVLATVAHVSGEDLICLTIVLGIVGTVVVALIAGRSLDDVL